MSTLAIGKGQLFHHFHGNYWASIVLVFDDQEQAAGALRVLGLPWKQSQKDARCLGCAVDSAQLEAVKRELARHGADVRAIDSLRKSVDCGEPFTVNVPLLPPAAPRPEGWREFADSSGSMVQQSLAGLS